MIGRVAAVAAAGSLGLVMMAFGLDGGGSISTASPLDCTVTGPAAGATATAGTATRPAGSTTTNWNAEQIGNATTISNTTRAAVKDPAHPDFNRPALPARAAVIAVATAMQESKLINVGFGDRDSLGLFQQRPSQGWGSPDQVMDPTYATNAFLARLIHVADWATLPLTQAAQAVQRSGFPDAYAQWEHDATAIVAGVTGTDPGQIDCQGGAGLPADAPADARVAAVLQAAQTQLGVDYVWGAGNATGPTLADGATGCTPGAAGCGFDCSGYMVYAWAQLGVALPHFSGDQAKAGTRIPLTQARPGDLIFLSSNHADSGIHHVAMIFYPDGASPRIIEAQQTGVPVHIRTYRGPAEPEIMPYAVRLT